jgi:threonylcarbamoyladenosine tRNA methylthiotransferase MtaB
MNIYLDMVGCRLNQSEIERMARQFRAAGHTLVAHAAEADLVVVNSCAVTAEAASDSRAKVRQAARTGNARVVLTGCWATIDPQAAAGLPSVSLVIPNEQKEQLAEMVLGQSIEDFELEPIERQPLPGSRGRTRAFIKAQDGCDNFCTFCVTRIARGAGRSRTFKEIHSDIQAALSGGAKEIVLTGVHLGSWGRDLSPGLSLKDLLVEVLEHAGMERLRLSSLEPWGLEPGFFDLWQDKRLCRHFHLPLQSGSTGVLRRMVRKTTPEEFSAILTEIRTSIPGAAITTDIIVGFPGETEAEFEESVAFVRLMQFAGGHVFHFSPRPGTAAARLPGQIKGPVMKARSATMRGMLKESAIQFYQQFQGEMVDVLWESAVPQPDGCWLLEGLAGNYLSVSTLANHNRWNQIDHVHLVKWTVDGFEAILQTNEQRSRLWSS